MMARKNYASLSGKYSKLGQRGAALILMVFLLSLVMLTYTIKSLNGNELRAKETANTFQALAEAKAALISWSVNHPIRPGLMPYPDRNSDPGGYDGLSDCVTVATDYSHLIGRLPWKGGDYNDCNNLLSGLGREFTDGSNEPLWYAVSKNLVHIYSPSGDPVINPNIIDNPTYAWMTVYDKNGQLISDKVAAIIFAPGPPMNDQDRSGGMAGASHYLDTFSFQAGGGAKSNRTYSSANEDFYMGEDSRGVRADNAIYQQPYYFNDKIIYITIDELISEIEKRAALEAKRALNKYQVSNSFFPYAAPFLLNQSFHCKSAQLEGMLPINSSPSISSCSCTSSTSCSCPFNLISSVSFKRSGTSTWSSANVSGACTRSPNSQTCTCTGAGYCRNSTGSRSFICNSAGACIHNTTGTFTFNGVFTDVTANTQSGSCTLSLCGNTPSPINASPPAATCTGSGSFSYTPCGDPPLTGLPAWFISNKWQDFFYYSISRASPTLTSGTKTGVQALLVSTGNPITTAAQSRPSCNINDYLDSVENEDFDIDTNADSILDKRSVFDATDLHKNSSYNDRVFIVAP